MPRQLTFHLPARPALGREDFLVAPSNAAAVGMVEAPDAWPGRKLVLAAPPGAGKTHLAHVFAAATGARIVPAAALVTGDLPALSQGPIAIEEADTLAGDAPAERALFHLHNLCQAQGAALLLTARTAPSRWGLTLPDLASRMEGTAMVGIEPPDDALLAGLIVKHFADRQLRVGPDVVTYLAARMERSAEAALRVAARLDALNLREKRPITRALAARALDNDGG